MWIIVLIGFLSAIIAQFHNLGFTYTTLLIVLPSVAAMLKIVYDNSAKFRHVYRTVLNTLNFNTFDMEFSAVFKLTEMSESFNVNKDYEKIQQIFHKILNQNGFKEKRNELIDLSFDKISGIKLYIHPYKMYFSIDQTDNFGENNLNLKASGRLKYKNGEKTIENFNVKLYAHLMEELKLDEIKYILKLEKNTKKKDFMKRHFIKEVDSDEIQSFQIKIDDPNVNLTVNNRELVLVASEKSYLINSIKNTVKLIT